MKTESDTVIIQNSKIKILLLAMLSIAFVLLGFYLWSIAEIQAHYPVLYVKTISVLTILFFGTGCLILPYKLLDKRPGLVIDSYGIQYNYGGSNGQFFIEWRNITGFKIKEIKRTKLILIFISNADEIINKENWWKQKLMRLSQKMNGTPLSISSGTLKYSFNELYTLLSERWEAQRKK